MFNIHLQAYNKAHCMCHLLICTTLGTFSLSQRFTLGFVDRSLRSEHRSVSASDFPCNLGPITKFLCISFSFYEVVTTIPVLEVPQAEQIETWMEYVIDLSWC